MLCALSRAAFRLLFGLFLNTVAFIFPFYLVHFGAISVNVLLL